VKNQGDFSAFDRLEKTQAPKCGGKNDISRHFGRENEEKVRRACNSYQP
jgi:hypothetical protein